MPYEAPIVHGNPDEPSLVAVKPAAKAPKLPAACLLVFDRAHLKLVAKAMKREKLGHSHLELYRFRAAGASLGAAYAGLGAPAAALALEELAGLGIKSFVAVGSAGGLQRKMRLGEYVLCSHAVREEGTSYHYAAPARFAYADAGLTKRLAEGMTKHKLAFRRGSSWTTDAPYRETRSKVRRYQKEGVLAVEMEASALFTVAEARGVKMSACFAISDLLGDLEWKPGFDSRELKAAWPPLLKAACEALAASVKGG